MMCPDIIYVKINDYRSMEHQLALTIFVRRELRNHACQWSVIQHVPHLPKLLLENSSSIHCFLAKI